MVIRIGEELENAIVELAGRTGNSAENLVLATLRNRFLRPPLTPQDEWEKRLLSAASDCGVSLSDEAVSSDGLYE